MGSKTRKSVEKKDTAPHVVTPLMNDLRQLIEHARQNVAVAVNTALSILYWRIGKRILQELLQNSRGEYGEEIVSTVSRHLEEEYGSGFSSKNVRHMISFARAFPDDKIVSTLSRQLSWSHFKEIIYLKQPFQKEFYAEMCRKERWSVRALRQKIASMLYERTALSHKPEKLIEQEITSLRNEDRLSPDLVFRDPYVLDFLGLKDTFSEKDLEVAILREMETFIMELGTGFAFLARQKRISLDSDDFYIDLLFFHRHLRRLVAVELKLDKFRPEYKGQMELYLRWLDKYERQEGEDSPIGLILCAGKKHEQIELLELGESGIHVAEYLTAPLKKDVLKKKLHRAYEIARKNLETRDDENVVKLLEGE